MTSCAIRTLFQKRVSQTKIFGAFCVAVLFCGTAPFCQEAVATTYYVRPDGNDSNVGIGSGSSLAWASVSGAARKGLSAGDVVYVQAGSYVGTVTPTVDGVSGNRIQFIADTKGATSGWPTGEVVLVAPSSSRVLDLDASGYLAFVGFKLAGDSGAYAVNLSNYCDGILLSKCEVTGGSRGIQIENSSETIVNCLIHGNAGSGIESTGSSSAVTIWNCTIANNDSGVFHTDGTTILTNSIIANNTNEGLHRAAGTFTHTYNTVYANGTNFSGTSQGTGELTGNPLFVGTGDYHLRSTSPAANTGINAAGTVDDDFHGNPRPYNGSWDQGYHEYGSTTGSISLLLVTANNGFVSTQERIRKTLFEAWDYAVTTVWAGASQSTYDAALAGKKVAYTSDQASDSDISYKLRETTVSVVSEVRCLSNEIGFSTSACSKSTSTDTLTITDNSHPITTGFALGPLVVFSSNQKALSLKGSQAAGLTVLGDIKGKTGLGLVDLGGTLANTYSGSNIAAGKRVQLPFGDGSFDFGSLTENGKTIVQRVLDWAAVSGTGLVGHWRFDDAAGIVAVDSSGSGNDADLLVGATWTSDCVGRGAIEFNTTGDYAITSQDFSPPDVGAVAFWMRGAGPLSVRQRLFGLSDHWEVKQELDGTLTFDLAASPSTPTFVTTTAVDKQNRWYHIVAMYDATDETYSVYIDGELHKSGTSSVDLTTQSAARLSFGKSTGSSEYWAGALREFRVYNRPLTNSEIANLSGVIAHWKFDESSGVVAYDVSVAGNDAIYTANPTLGVDGAFVPKTGTAVDLNGKNQWINSGASLLNDLPEFTLSGWVRPDSVNPTQAFMGQKKLIELGIEKQTNQINFWTKAAGEISVTGVLPVGKWSHIAAVGNSLGLKLYVDGREVVSGGNSSAGFGNNGSDFKIGNGVLKKKGDFFDGRMDDVRVYGRAMCPEEVRSIYKGGRPTGVRIIKWIETR